MDLLILKKIYLFEQNIRKEGGRHMVSISFRLILVSDQATERNNGRGHFELR